ncbi:MAG: hypothetical protein OEQ47_04920 [Acidimicrobiia bacterium]|nr:hypothetical protein [Acidimicrobiia bacterium]
MAGKTIFDPAYMADLKRQVQTSRGEMAQAIDALESKYQGHAGLWEDAGATGPATTFGELIAEFRGVMNQFLANLDTTAGNVDSYDQAMADVATTFNFAAAG